MVQITFLHESLHLCNRSQGGANLSFPHVFGGNLLFFRPMDARLKHSGTTEAIILS
ncbi:hypothetical protein JW964_04695 [candidate division KSB1 bacterium]|nr:hypothetical protein [candidate division KSB1 bacterium]